VPKSLYLIKRGPRPEYHRAPFHPVIICDRKRVAEWEPGNTGDAAWVWEKMEWTDNGYGWLLCRWNGFDVDYGHVVHSITMPDRSVAGFWRDYESEYRVDTLITGATWWSDKPMPEWLLRHGVKYPADTFTQQRILDFIANDNCSGFGRAVPKWWPEGIEPECLSISDETNHGQASETKSS